MNLKFMLLSAMLLTASFFNQTQAIEQLTSYGAFEAAAQGHSVIAVASAGNSIFLPRLIGQLTKLEGEFPQITFAYAVTEDIPEYQLPDLGVILFKNNKPLGLQAPLSTAYLESCIKQYFGN